MPDQGGSLTVVGTGIDITTQLSPGARAAIESADIVLYVLADPVSSLRVERLNPRVRSLEGHYAAGKRRRITYDEMVEEVVSEVLAGQAVCLALYGHPGVYAAAGHEAVRRVRDAGLPARMLPAVSALDCLFADLGVDPGPRGLQAYEATYFFRTRPPVDARAMLLLLQVGVLCNYGGEPSPVSAERFPSLVELLRSTYGPECEAVIYEAAMYPGARPVVTRFRLADRELPSPSVMSTLCITP